MPETTQHERLSHLNRKPQELIKTTYLKACLFCLNLDPFLKAFPVGIEARQMPKFKRNFHGSVKIMNRKQVKPHNAVRMTLLCFGKSAGGLLLI